MGNEFEELRPQILSNARLLLGRSSVDQSRRDTTTGVPTQLSNMTLVNTPQNTVAGDIEVVIFGVSNEYTAAVMVGVTPAVEGLPAKSPELALRVLLTATCELLNTYMPKLGATQRNIHGGGVYDESLISQELANAKTKT